MMYIFSVDIVKVSMIRRTRWGQYHLSSLDILVITVSRKKSIDLLIILTFPWIAIVVVPELPWFGDLQNQYVLAIATDLQLQSSSYMPFLFGVQTPYSYYSSSSQPFPPCEFFCDCIRIKCSPYNFTPYISVFQKLPPVFCNKKKCIKTKAYPVGNENSESMIIVCIFERLKRDKICVLGKTQRSWELNLKY